MRAYDHLINEQKLHILLEDCRMFTDDEISRIMDCIYFPTFSGLLDACHDAGIHLEIGDIEELEIYAEEVGLEF